VDPLRYPRLTASRVPLSKQEVDIFYKSFSKEAFWPTLHTFWERARFREAHWQVFLKVNQAFAQRTAAEAAEGATVWLHDYNLWMVPAYLRELRPDLKIAFFHHTYFPSADVFNVIPWRRAIVGSLLQCDYVGFHIPRQVENFVDVVRGTTPMKIVERASCAPRFVTYGCATGLEHYSTSIEVSGRQVRLGAHPVGLDLRRIEEALALPAIRRRMAELRESMAGTRVLLSIERLDYTKGILERLQAFEGIVIGRKHGDEAGGTFTVRKVTSGVGVEKIFPIYSPMIDKIEIVKRSKVRQAKLYHIRTKATKEISRQMRNIRKAKDDQDTVAQEVVAAKAE
jgi:glucosylglycerol-phosphate synthase